MFRVITHNVYCLMNFLVTLQWCVFCNAFIIIDDEFGFALLLFDDVVGVAFVVDVVAVFDDVLFKLITTVGSDLMTFSMKELVLVGENLTCCGDDTKLICQTR